MITIQVVARGNYDAYQLLRDKVTHEAKTWSWSNKAKTRLSHTNGGNGYIEVGSADKVLVAQIYPGNSAIYFLPEKFIGRLVAWFNQDLFAINIQFIPEAKNKRK